MSFMPQRPAIAYASSEADGQFPDPEIPETTTPPVEDPAAEAEVDRGDVLARICARTRVDVEQRSQIMSLKEITTRAREVSTPTRGFGQALQHLTADRQVGLIAEIKKASPSAGILRPEYDPVGIARAYQAAGATCLSVLTEGSCFHGKTDDIRLVREACSLPILRKDFILDPWQVHESRLIGADCILLIMAALSESQASELIAIARGLDMDVLVEVHDEDELTRALALDTFMIGINNRNLKTLKTDIQTTIDLAPMVPPDRLVISESGIRTQSDLMRVGDIGASAVLVGESLLRQDDPGAAARKLLGF
ncbi:indole-3-glycerol phosphate synthase TrpC [Gluconobacter wancherniae]|uniref:Indole-3-glycerol phosphate synthase n=1 Tax=Gluconobacter wancherniae NBRC 103581 TaxID=656744 RepID=A0A511AYH6_9PROT|nr:indole-3-glycerol phosphate synthase TrpC [Gluconobacter wancherniae]MBF0853425.1 indole-3-glycerol phosphate synthase TrpC [Gluconobacter wancherniae]MBS1063342.1 indole-3-glycerol phosphate synthase TrpC [Gluconobacter wancherniae]MBS1093925.1 indole-3-glycerol phosphate synthase TrpC [Gluconobacter wancherniae]GBD55843.1 indole-3-glycerol phosphate synthase [Gluconobacter wancherniae NBRC 103581]GBR66036.1 indole-3-glycerol phosphate synthase [Gluconobacter wancherniae NBRC 103581]